MLVDVTVATDLIDAQDLLERLEESISVYDRDARFVYLNAAATRPFGRPRQELIGKRPWDLAPSGTGPSPFRVALEAVLAGGPRAKVTSFALGRWYDVDVYPHELGAIALARDVTAARTAHEELAHSEARFRAMVESSPEAIVILDVSTGRFCDANREAEELFGCTRERLLSIGPGELSAPVQRDEVDWASFYAAALDEVIAGKIVVREWAVRGPNDKPMTLEVRLRRLPSSDAVLIRGSLFDVTARKRAENQLAEVQRLEAVARLAGGVAHDFNNMLTVIIAGVQLALAELPEGHPARADLEDAMSAGERSALITRQLLAFGRKQAETRIAVNLSHYIDSMIPVLERLVGEDVELVSEVADPLENVQIGSGHVAQILLNLVANARDAMPSGGRITLQTANVVLEHEHEPGHDGVPPGRYAMMTVADTGQGIPASVLPHIFEPFFTTKALHRGTGLGLSTVYGIVKQEGGHIWIDSEVGRGTTFKVYLPMIAKAGVTAPALPRPHEAVRGGSETILIVEDEDPVRRVLVRTVQRAGYTVLEAANAGEALLAIEQQGGKIDLLLTDVVMPRMSGPQLVARVRRDWPAIRVVYLSGYNDARLEQPDQVGSYDALLEKPVPREVLLDRLRDVLDR